MPAPDEVAAGDYGAAELGSQAADYSLEFVSHSVGQTRRIGERLGELAEAGDVVLLTGNLGSGKTCLSQGIAAGLGIHVPITSPTFTLLNEYTRQACGGRLPLYHADLYRLESAEAEALDLGIEEYLYGAGLTIVEWAERAPLLWPADHLAIRLRIVSETKRSLRLVPTGSRYQRMMREFRRRAFGL